MSFLNPTLALIALGCVAAPVVIHLLFRRRTRPLEWGAMRFVLEAFRRQRKRMRLEQFLILAARTLAVLLLALAVGRPMFAGESLLQSRTPRDLVLVIDNTLTAQARVGEATELDLNKKEALRLLDGLDAARGDRAALITLGAPADKLATPLSTELAGVRRAVESVEATESASDPAGAFAAARDLLGRDAARQSSIALLSALRRGSFDPARAPEVAESAARPELLVQPPAAQGLDNIAIVSVEPLRSVLLRESGAPETQQARVTLTRSGPGMAAASAVNLRLAAIQTGDADAPAWATTPVRFNAGQETASVLVPIGFPKADPGVKKPVAPLWIEARVDDDAILADNLFRKPWKARETVRVVLAAPVGDTAAAPTSYAAADWITLALAPRTGGVSGALEAENEPITLSRVDPSRLSPADLLTADAVFVTRPDLLAPDGWSTLADFTRKGGLVGVTAPTLASVGIHLWPEPMLKAFGLSWVVARETSEATPARTTRAGANDTAGLSALLSGLSAELDELVKPIAVARWLGVELKGDASRLLTLDDGAPLLIAARPDNSPRGLLVVLLTAPELESTSLPAMPLMVPLFQEIVRQGIGLAAGSTTVLAGASIAEPAELRRVAPAGTAAMGDAARAASLWRRVDARGLTRELIAVNPDTRGSSTEAQSKDQLAPALRAAAQASGVTFLEPANDTSKPSRDALPRINRTPPIDLPLLIAGLLLLVIDALLSRWFSHATVGSPAAALGARSASVTTPASAQRGAAA